MSPEHDDEWAKDECACGHRRYWHYPPVADSAFPTSCARPDCDHCVGFTLGSAA